jgi:hypothetical protein
VAPVTGNSAYPGRMGLTNPVNDAADVTAALRRIGFEVAPGTDLELSPVLRKSSMSSARKPKARLRRWYFALATPCSSRSRTGSPISTRVGQEHGLMAHD